MGRIKKGERGGKAVPGWRGSEELGTLASLEHMACAGEQLGWADSLGLYFKDLEFLVRGYVIYPYAMGLCGRLMQFCSCHCLSSPKSEWPGSQGTQKPLEQKSQVVGT